MGSERARKNPRDLDGVADMTKLTYIEEEHVLHNIHVRTTKKRQPYSGLGDILVAVNPYKPRPELTDVATMTRYDEEKLGQDLEPHILKVAQKAYRFVCIDLPGVRTPPGVREAAYRYVPEGSSDAEEEDVNNQSVIVCGESGSGKTESAKFVMQYLAFCSRRRNAKGGDVDRALRFVEANDVIEAFGNAQTVINDNSSRFAKFTKLVMGDGGLVEGSFINTYLLETSRVVDQSTGERNFHVFHYLWLLPSKIKQALHLPPTPEGLRYVRCEPREAKRRDPEDRQRLAAMQTAFASLGFGDDNVQNIYRILASIVHLGNLTFEDGPHGSSALVMTDGVAWVCDLLGCDKAALVRLLTTNVLIRTTKPGNRNASITPLKLSPDDAKANVATIAKTMYGNVFGWIIQTINRELGDNIDSKMRWIGVLDVFGFESFDSNGFEQFFINFANERLQQYFNEHIILSEHSEYKAERLPPIQMEPPDNSLTLRLLENAPMKSGVGKPGIINMLHDFTRSKNTDVAKFVTELNSAFQDNCHYKAVDLKTSGGVGCSFTIKHYAGTVTYHATQFLAKNGENVLHSTLIFAKNECKGNPLVSKLFEQNLEEAAPSGRGRAASSRSPRFKSTGTLFVTRLQTLIDELNKTRPHFVRCVKPNKQKSSTKYNKEHVKDQLRCGGLVQALKIMKLGYPCRCSYSDVKDRYADVLRQLGKTELVSKDMAVLLLKFCCPNLQEGDDFRLGLTKVFFRPGKQAALQQLMGNPQTLSDETVGKMKEFIMVRRRKRILYATWCVLQFRENGRRNAKLRELRAVAADFWPRLTSIRAKRAAWHALWRGRMRAMREASTEISAQREAVRAQREAEAPEPAPARVPQTPPRSPPTRRQQEAPDVETASFASSHRRRDEARDSLAPLTRQSAVVGAYAAKTPRRASVGAASSIFTLGADSMVGLSETDLKTLVEGAHTGEWKALMHSVASYRGVDLQLVETVAGLATKLKNCVAEIETLRKDRDEDRLLLTKQREQVAAALRQGSSGAPSEAASLRAELDGLRAWKDTLTVQWDEERTWSRSEKASIKTMYETILAQQSKHATPRASGTSSDEFRRFRSDVETWRNKTDRQIVRWDDRLQDVSRTHSESNEAQKFILENIVGKLNQMEIDMAKVRGQQQEWDERQERRMTELEQRLMRVVHGQEVVPASGDPSEAPPPPPPSYMHIDALVMRIRALERKLKDAEVQTTSWMNRPAAVSRASSLSSSGLAGAGAGVALPEDQTSVASDASVTAQKAALLTMVHANYDRIVKVRTTLARYKAKTNANTTAVKSFATYVRCETILENDIKASVSGAGRVSQERRNSFFEAPNPAVWNLNPIDTRGRRLSKATSVWEQLAPLAPLAVAVTPAPAVEAPVDDVDVAKAAPPRTPPLPLRPHDEAAGGSPSHRSASFSPSKDEPKRVHTVNTTTTTTIELPNFNALSQRVEELERVRNALPDLFMEAFFKFTVEAVLINLQKHQRKWTTLTMEQVLASGIHGEAIKENVPFFAWTNFITEYIVRTLGGRRLLADARAGPKVPAAPLGFGAASPQTPHRS